MMKTNWNGCWVINDSAIGRYSNTYGLCCL